jgi:hypothetical protein
MGAGMSHLHNDVATPYDARAGTCVPAISLSMRIIAAPRREMGGYSTVNIPLNFQCQVCKEPYDGIFIIGATNVEWDCKKCGQRNMGILDLDMTIGVQVWVKAHYELTRTKDASMAVILSAAAIDCELSHLFCKWTGISALCKYN